MSVSRLDSLVNTHPLPTWRPLARLIMALLIIGIAWAFFAQLDEVSDAEAEVIPQGKVRVVQHLEGGIIQELLVKEGDAVKAGAPLVQLDLATSGVNKKELLVRLDAHMLKIARLVAEATDAELKFPQEEAERRPTLVQAEINAYDARKAEQKATISVLKEQSRQRELEVAELKANLEKTKKNLSVTRERYNMSSRLLRKKLTSRLKHLELEAELQALQGELNTLEPSIPRAEAAVSESLRRMEETKISFQREAREQLGQEEQNAARVRELLAEATDQGKRALIRSPIDGIIKNLKYFTIGGVVRPGEAIMEIVPSGENLVIEAKLNPMDRGYVKIGQKSTVKISTYDFARYGGLDGEVTLIAPDTTTSEDGNTFYRVIIETEKSYLGDKQGDLPITPGMQATVDIHTGKKSVMDYLIKPVLKLRHEAFRER